MKNARFKTTIASIEDVEVESGVNNPFLTKIKFIFSDNKGNGNNQGIDETEFDSIASSSINMPIKMNYSESEGDIDGHPDSTPIGHIVGMTRETVNDVSQLVGEALLYREEYPKEVQWLKDKFASGEAPGVSWELAYSDSVLKDGVEWLKKAVTMAATFVRSPAYGKRTRLLAIAQAHTNDQEFMTELKEIVDSWASTNIPEKGGNEVEEELEKAKAQLEELKAKITDLEGKLTEADKNIETLTESNKTLAEENNSFKTQATLNARTAKISEAGIKFELEGEALQTKQAFWLSMSEEAFESYVSDLAAVAAKAPENKGTASQNQDGLPRFTAVAGQELSLDDLKSAARKASRGEIAE